MSIYFAPIVNSLGSGVYTTAEMFLGLSPWTKAVIVTAALAIPILSRCRNRSATIEWDKSDPKISFSANSYNDEIIPVKVHSWNVENKEISLINFGSKLELEILGQAGSVTKKPIPVPQDRSIEACIDNLKRLRPIIGINDSINFTSKCQSMLNNGSNVDNNTWAVTLVNSGSSSTLGPTSWGSHAALFIEGVVDAKYFIYRAHIVSVDCGNPFTGASDKAEVEFERVDECFDKLKKNFKGKSVTWLRSKDEINAMLLAIEKERGKKIPFSIRGCDAHITMSEWIMRKIYPEIDEVMEKYRPDNSSHNCLTWARTKLKIANICLPRIYRYLYRATLPTDYVTPITN